MTAPLAKTRLQLAAAAWHPNLKKRFIPKAPPPPVTKKLHDEAPIHSTYKGTHSVSAEQAARNRETRRKLAGYLEGG
jgi:hypothetical protein